MPEKPKFVRGLARARMERNEEKRLILKKTVEERSRPSADPAFPDCREWTGQLSKGGHPFMRYGFRGIRSGITGRRAAWLAERGFVPAGNLLTTCGNKLCVKVEHLSESARGSGRHVAVIPETAAEFLVEAANSLLFSRTNKDLCRKYGFAPQTGRRLFRMLEDAVDGVEPPDWARSISPMESDTVDGVLKAFAVRFMELDD